MKEGLHNTRERFRLQTPAQNPPLQRGVDVGTGNEAPESVHDFNAASTYLGPGIGLQVCSFFAAFLVRLHTSVEAALRCTVTESVTARVLPHAASPVPQCCTFAQAVRRHVLRWECPLVWSLRQNGHRFFISRPSWLYGLAGHTDKLHPSSVS